MKTRVCGTFHSLFTCLKTRVSRQCHGGLRAMLGVFAQSFAEAGKGWVFVRQIAQSCRCAMLPQSPEATAPPTGEAGVRTSLRDAFLTRPGRELLPRGGAWGIGRKRAVYSLCVPAGKFVEYSIARLRTIVKSRAKLYHRNYLRKEIVSVIVYDRLWQTMKVRRISQHKLMREYSFSARQLVCLHTNQNVSTYTLDTLCRILSCDLEDIAEYRPDEK